MAATTTASHRGSTDQGAFGPLGRLGLAVTRHRRITAIVWLLVVLGLGFFAPRVEGALSGAGWQADGSQSVAVRQLAQAHFGGAAR
jgi:RND superfamily putative drug exporter